MDRDEIERHDFPVGRRGYDQAAVDEHLRQVADELERMRGRAGAAAPAPLSAGTSEQVRLILEAAERSAAQLRDDAGRQAGDHVARVGEAAAGMLAQIDALERELGGLLAALREAGGRVSDQLARVEEQVIDLSGTGAEPPEPPAPPAPPAAPAPAKRSRRRAPAAPDPVEPPAAVEDVAPAAPASANGDEAGARLTALNMALSGTPREETAAYLAEHFELADPEALLDDVYARAGG
jgi:DivIVA domain-containing protein